MPIGALYFAGQQMENQHEKERLNATPQSIDKEVFRWWATLPESARPVRLAKTFPRIVNQIAARWSNVPRCEIYLRELIVDPARSDRHGFPYEIALEILALQTLLTLGDPNARIHKDGAFKFGE